MSESPNDDQRVTLGEVYRAVLRTEAQAKETNGRLRKVESRQAVDLQRFGSIANELSQTAEALEGHAGRLERLERAKAAPKPARALVLRIGGVGAGLGIVATKVVEVVGRMFGQ